MSKRIDRKRRPRGGKPQGTAAMLQETFPDWSLDDLSTVLADSGNDLERAAERIVAGEVQPWGQVKSRKEIREQKAKEHKVSEPTSVGSGAPQDGAESRKSEKAVSKKGDRKPKKTSEDSAEPVRKGKGQAPGASSTKNSAPQPTPQPQKVRENTWADILSGKVPEQIAQPPAAPQVVEQATLQSNSKPVQPVVPPVPSQDVRSTHGYSEPQKQTQEPAKPTPLLPIQPTTAGGKLNWGALIPKDTPATQTELPAEGLRQESQTSRQKGDKSERKQRRTRRKNKDDKEVSQEISALSLQGTEANLQSGAAEQQQQQANQQFVQQVDAHAGAPQIPPQIQKQQHERQFAQDQQFQSPTGQLPMPYSPNQAPGLPQGQFQYDYPQQYQNQPHGYPQQRYQFDQFQGSYEYDFQEQQQRLQSQAQHTPHHQQNQQQAQHGQNQAGQTQAPQLPGQTAAAGGQSPYGYAQQPYFVTPPAYAYYYQNFGYNGQQYPGPMPKNYQQPFYNQLRSQPGQNAQQQPQQQQQPQPQQPQHHQQVPVTQHDFNREPLYNYQEQQYQVPPRQGWEFTK